MFCEKGVFDTEQSKQILKTGTNHGMKINFHGDEIHFMASGELAGDETDSFGPSHIWYKCV